MVARATETCLLSIEPPLEPSLRLRDPPFDSGQRRVAHDRNFGQRFVGDPAEHPRHAQLAGNAIERIVELVESPLVARVRRERGDVQERHPKPATATPSGEQRLYLSHRY